MTLGTVPAALTPVLGRSQARFVGVGLIMTIAGMVFHIRDSKMNLMLAFIPTGGLLALFGTVVALSPVPEVSLYAFFAGALSVALLDFHCIMNYPRVLAEVGRHRLHAAVEMGEKEDGIRTWLMEEEERVKRNGEELERMEEVEAELEKVRTDLAEKSRLLMVEEENLNRMEREVQNFRTEVAEQRGRLMEEEENLRVKEAELAQVRQEAKAREEHMMEEEERIRSMEAELTEVRAEVEGRRQHVLEEEERLKTREEDAIRLGTDFEIQNKLMDEMVEKAKMMEEELVRMKGEMEHQVRMRLEEEERIRLKKAASAIGATGARGTRSAYPFTAIVGQQRMKLALILNAVYPEIGGVLIRGQKGTGKSIAIRGLAEILPEIDVVEGCRYNCDPAEQETFCDDCRLRLDKDMLNAASRPIRVVDLPLNTTEDRLVGSIDIEKVLTAGVRAFEPGLLAEAHRGILHVDEINLLDDYVVDILLDSAASGVVAVEREGVSISYPARFIIVGSMNPEEGELRPQLLDRLALSVDVGTIQDVAERVEIVKRLEEFTTSPAAFRERFSAEQEALRDRIRRARALVSRVAVPRPLLTTIANLCLSFRVEGHRADIIIQRAAVANAAFHGRTTVNAEDIAVGAELALPHRMKRKGFEKGEAAADAVRRLLRETVVSAPG